MLVAALVLVIIFATVACLWNQGMWSAAIMFFNVMTAAMLATIMFEPVASALPAGLRRSNYADFFALWGLFIVFAGLLRLVTDFASRANVKFIWPVDISGAIFFAIWTGWVLACFTATSLHVAPLARTSLGGSFMPSPDVDDPMALVGPDRLWLAFIHSQSQGGLARDEHNIFDPDGQFIYKYAARRLRSETPEK
ncbi:MAG: hypothetical protein WD176_05005 [Pirellulales bacterium]